MTMIRTESIAIHAPADNVWDIAAGRFGDIGLWSSGVQSSSAVPAEGGSSPAGAPCRGRVCATPQGETVETFLAFDASERSFTYEVTGDAMPGFVERATNTWRLTAEEGGKTRLSMTIEMETKGLIGKLMKPMMSAGMGKVLRQNLEDLKHFIETGDTHPRKKNA